MRTTVISDVKGGDLPREWATKAGLGPNDRVDVVIRPTRAELVDRLVRLSQRIGAKPQNQALTEEKLAELLRDD